MPQVVHIKANGNYEFQMSSGEGFCETVYAVISSELQEKIDSVISMLNSLGANLIHVEKDDWREFEHIVIAGQVQANDFGTTISPSEFDAIIAAAQTEMDDQLAASLAQAENNDTV